MGMGKVDYDGNKSETSGSTYVLRKEIEAIGRVCGMGSEAEPRWGWTDTQRAGGYPQFSMKIAFLVD